MQKTVVWIGWYFSLLDYSYTAFCKLAVQGNRPKVQCVVYTTTSFYSECVVIVVLGTCQPIYLGQPTCKTQYYIVCILHSIYSFTFPGYAHNISIQAPCESSICILAAQWEFVIIYLHDIIMVLKLFCL